MKHSEIWRINDKLDDVLTVFCGDCPVCDDEKKDHFHIGKAPEHCQMAVMASVIIEEVVKRLKTTNPRKAKETAE